MEEELGTSERPLRCMLQQVALPRYKVPYYVELSKRAGIDLVVLYGDSGSPNADAPGDLKVEFRKIRHLPGDLKWDGVFLGKLRRGAFDAVSMSWNTRQLGLIPGILRAKRNGIGVVVWGHGYSKNEGSLRRWLRWKVANLADAIVTYTPSVGQRYVEGGLPAEKVFCALNSLDQGPIQAARDAWLNEPGKLDAFRRSEGLSDGPMVLFVSRLFQPNRTDLLIEAAAKLRDRFPGLVVAIIGKGPDHDRLVESARVLGVSDMVRFLGPVYGEESLAPWFLSARAFCYPRNIGLSILHAFGYGVPVVTSDHVASHNPEIEAFRDGENGLFYRDGDIDHLAEQLARLFTNDALRRRLGAEAHRTATEEFTIKRMADGMEAALRHAARQAKLRGRASRG